MLDLNQVDSNTTRETDYVAPPQKNKNNGIAGCNEIQYHKTKHSSEILYLNLQTNRGDVQYKPQT